MLEHSSKKIYSRQPPNNFHFYNENMGFVDRMDKNVVKCWYPNEKMVAVSVCLIGRWCYSGFVGIVLTMT